jgi:DNA-binding NarL/FixJ family response regulator
MNVIRLVIADDHTLFGEGLQALFQSIPDIEVAGFARSGAEAVAMATDLQPDVVLMDIQMPGVNGIQATRRILQANPHIGVMMLTMFEDDDTVFAAIWARHCHPFDEFFLRLKTGDARSTLPGIDPA